MCICMGFDARKFNDTLGTRQLQRRAQMSGDIDKGRPVSHAGQ